ncbi:MAG: hypothetical protein J6M20_11985 [Clostridia bacterium]|nr:hypothetical protein [Clostridia bacterium]
MVLFAETKRTTLHDRTVAKESNALQQAAEPLLPSSPYGESTSLEREAFGCSPYICTAKLRAEAIIKNPFINTLSHPHPVNSVDNPPKSATIFPLKEGIISPSMEYNHEGKKYSTHQVEKVTLYPQNIHPKK